MFRPVGVWSCSCVFSTLSVSSSSVCFWWQRPFGAAAMGGALARPSWLSSPTLGRANRFLSTAAVSLMTPRRPLTQPEKVKVRTLAVEQRTEEDSESLNTSLWLKEQSAAVVLQESSLNKWWQVQERLLLDRRRTDPVSHVDQKVKRKRSFKSLSFFLTSWLQLWGGVLIINKSLINAQEKWPRVLWRVDWICFCSKDVFISDWLTANQLEETS